MFNGIIQTTGNIELIKEVNSGAILKLNAGNLAVSLKNGDSIAVDGVCLTVVRKNGKSLQIDVSGETWNRTNLSKKTKGSRVNLESPLTMGTFISGHFLQGHVEGVGQVASWQKTSKQDVRLSIRMPKDLIRYCVQKGSIAINGVSLTIAGLRKKVIEIALIPYTLEHTNLGELQRGDWVNIETDVIGRYVVSAVEKAYHNRISSNRKSKI